MKTLYTIEEYSQYKDINKRTVYKQIASNKIESIKKGKITYIVGHFEAKTKVVEVEKIIYKDTINTLNEMQQLRDEIDANDSRTINYIFYTFLFSSVIASSITFYIS